MSLSHYDTRQNGNNALLMSGMVVNATFAVTTLFWWTALSLFVSEPVRWATWHGISPNPEIYEYPFVLLWTLPLFGMVTGWIAFKAKRFTLSYFLCLYPLGFLGLMFGWFHFAPPDWR